MARTTATFTVTSGNNDAREEANGTVELTRDRLLFNSAQNGSQVFGPFTLYRSAWDAYHFQNVTIPSGKYIVDARIELYVPGTTLTAIQEKVYVEQTATAVDLTTTASNVSNRTIDAGIAWDGAATPAGIFHTSPSINSALQTVVQKPAWTSGNNIIVIIEALSSTSHFYHAHRDLGASFGAKLVVTYDDDFPLTKRPTATIENQINAPVGNVFRRAFIKRRSASTGLYETDWFNITEFVKSWGTIKLSVDELRLNKFRHSGITLKVRNDGGDFNPNSNDQSLWNGFMTRYRTLLKIEAGYSTWDDTELPTDPTLGIFILTNDVDISGVKNEALLKFNSLQTVFEQVKAKDVAGLGATQTASDLIAKFRDASDGVGTAIFTQFITSTAWGIQATIANYNLATSTTIEEKNCWEVMSKLAEAEGFLLLINRTGGVEFRDRNERTSTSQFTLKGQGFNDSNIIQLTNYLEPVTKLFNNFRLKYIRDDTSTSFLTAGTTTTVNPSQSVWQFGVHQYEFENLWFPDTTTAQAAIDNLVTQFDVIKEEIKVKCKFIPQLEVSDKVLLNYHSYDIIGESRWDLFEWASDSAILTEDAEWAGQIGENFDWNGEQFKILSKIINLDKFTTSFHLRHL